MWANKFQNRWFVRIDGRGIPVYGSLIDRPNKPSQGRWIEITACLPQQICCTVPPAAAILSNELDPGTFGASTGIQITIPGLLNLQVPGATAVDAVAALQAELTASYAGFGTWNVDFIPPPGSGNVQASLTGTTLPITTITLAWY